MSSITEMLPCIDSCFMFSLDFASILVETNSGRLQLGGKNWALCICIACDGHTKLCVCTMHSKRQKYFKVTNGKSATDDDHKRWYRLWCSFLGAEVWCQCVRDLYICNRDFTNKIGYLSTPCFVKWHIFWFSGDPTWQNHISSRRSVSRASGLSCVAARSKQAKHEILGTGFLSLIWLISQVLAASPQNRFLAQRLVQWRESTEIPAPERR